MVHVSRLGGDAAPAVGAFVAGGAEAVGREAVGLGGLDLGALVPLAPAGHADHVGAGAERRPPQRVVAQPAAGGGGGELGSAGRAGAGARGLRTGWPDTPPPGGACAWGPRSRPGACGAE